MTGRNSHAGRGGRGGRGPRTNRSGRGGNRSQSNKNYNMVAKFNPYTNSNGKKYSTYTNIIAVLKNRLKKEVSYSYDIIECIDNMALIDLEKKGPTLQVSQKSNQIERDAENEVFKVRYREDVKTWCKRMDDFKSNILKVNGIIIDDFCTDLMVDRLKEFSNYETELTDDFTKLLIKISEIMYQTTDATNPYWGLLESMSRLYNMKQGSEETLYAYKDRMNQEASSVKAKLGVYSLSAFVKTTDEYKNASATDQTNLENNAFDYLVAMCYIRGCDRQKYQSLVDDLRSQYTRDNDQYPRNIDKAMTLLSKHRHDNRKNGTKKKGPSENPTNNNNSRATSFYQESSSNNGKKCYCCGATDHLLPDCPDKGTKPKEDWVKPSYWRAKYQREHQHHQSVEEDVDSALGGGIGWSHVMIPKKDLSFITKEHDLSFLTKENDNIMDCILLDSGSTIDIIGNEKFVENVRDSDTYIDVGTNGGDIRVTKEATLKNYGTVSFDKNIIANILSLKNLVKKYRVQFDSAYDNCFYVHTPDGIIRFESDSTGLYSYKPGKVEGVNKDKDSVKESNGVVAVAHIQTVEKNKEGFTAEQLKRAQEARKAYHVLFAPGVQNMKGIMRQNILDNCPVTNEDLRIADAVYGPDISTLRGRSTRPSPKKIVENQIEIPMELLRHNRLVKLYIDIMYINSCIFLTSIDSTVRFRAVVPLASRNHNEVFEAIKKIYIKYKNADLQVYVIYCDGEFKGLMVKVEEELQVYINYANPDDHVHQAERNNRVIKERVRIGYYRMPYNLIPAIMILYLGMQATHTMNYFPAKGGLSRYFSPYMILNERRVDYKTMCVCEFGAYVEASHFTTNRNTPRTIAAIYLRPASNIQEGHEVLDLQTKRVITRPKITEVPVNRQVIDAVERWGASEGFKSLKFYDRNKKEMEEVENVEVFLDADLTTGVDPTYLDEIDEDYDLPPLVRDDELTGVGDIDQD